MILNSILFDIGATKTRIAYSKDGQTFENPKVFDTSKNYEDGLNTFLNVSYDLAKGRDIKNFVGGMSRSIPNWNYDNLEDDIYRKSGIETFLENDSAIVGLGEAHWGAGRGFDIVAYITVSTGVGGAKISYGKIDEHTVGFEPGKQIIDAHNLKTLEDTISGKALEKKYGKRPKDITDPKIWDEEAKILAIGLNNIIVEWSPNCVVLGGSMITGNPSIPIDKTEKYLKDILKIFPRTPKIKMAELGEIGGLYGALAYLKTLSPNI